MMSDFIKMIRNIQLVLLVVGSGQVKSTLSTSRLVTLTVIASRTRNSWRWRGRKKNRNFSTRTDSSASSTSTSRFDAQHHLWGSP